MEPEPCLRLGVIVCCRDEERAIERRLANLANSHWPEAKGLHRVVVVDDGSRDGTAALAAKAISEAELTDPASPAAVKFELIANRLRPGKAGAITSGIEHLGASIEIVVLTDADVLNSPEALLELCRAFAGHSELGMAFGTQRFVAALSPDGSTAALGRGSAGGAYDRITAWVRALESRSGRAFSVHGQLLAWRARMNLRPRSAIAADDLDLMLQTRAAGMGVARVSRALFFEVKPAGALRRIQALRRARAYIQFMRTLELKAAPEGLTRWQWRAYLWIPRMFPWIALAGLVLTFRLLQWGVRSFADGPVFEDWRLFFEFIPWSVVAAGVAYLWHVCSVIVEAQHLERGGTLDDRWSTTR